MVLGPDLFDSTPAQVTQFKNQTGATYSLMLNCGLSGVGAENFFTTYGDRDSYAVINKQGIVRYAAFDHWPYGNRYHLNELRGCIDSLLTVTTGVDDSAPRAFALTASPNPAQGAITVELANPSSAALAARVEVYDLAGRERAVLWRGTAAPGLTRMTWSGQESGAAPVAPGVYLVRARIGGHVLTRRVLRLH